MHVSVDAPSLSINNCGSITGAVFLRGDGWCFPAEGWDDFVPVVLGWWLTALHGLTPKKRAECLFMDGSWAFQVTSIAPNEWLVECGDLDGNPPLHSSRVDAASFSASLLSACQTTVDACHNRGWENDDLSRLRLLCEIAAGAGT